MNFHYIYIKGYDETLLIYRIVSHNFIHTWIKLWLVAQNPWESKLFHHLLGGTQASIPTGKTSCDIVAPTSSLSVRTNQKEIKTFNWLILNKKAICWPIPKKTIHTHIRPRLLIISLRNLRVSALCLVAKKKLVIN